MNIDFIEQKNSDYIVVLGLGLGYEIEEIRKKTSKNIIVFEAERIFIEYAYEVDNCDIYYIDELSNQFVFSGIPQIVINKNIYDLNSKKYMSILTSIFRAKQKELIWVVADVFITDAICESLTKLGYKIEHIDADRIVSQLMQVSIVPDFVIGINYSAALAKSLKLFNVKYIAWNIDSPWVEMFAKHAMDYDNAIIFDFDKGMVDKVERELGLEIYYLPLAGKNGFVEDENITEQNFEKYHCDISFIGHSTVNNQFMQEIATKIPSEVLLTVMEYVLLQKNQSQYILESLIQEELFDKIYKSSTLECWNKNIQYFKNTDALAYDIAKLTSHKERVELVEFLSKYTKFHLYGDKNWEVLLNKPTFYKGIADYSSELHNIIKSTKININDTRPFFRDALPLRIFEIISCSGFCVTNYKENENTIFENGKHLIAYRDKQDLEEIIEYFLTHPIERNEVQQEGYEFLKKYHTLEIRLTEMLKKAQEVFYTRNLKNINYI